MREFAAAELKTTTLISTQAAVQGAFKHASEEMKGNEGIILAAKRAALQHASAQRNSDEAIVIAGVQHDGESREPATEQMNSNGTIDRRSGLKQ